MKLRILNIFFGSLVIAINLFTFIPWLFDILKTFYNEENYNLLTIGFAINLIFPMTFCFNLFLITGILGFFPIHKLKSKYIKSILTIVLLLTGFFILLFFWLFLPFGLVIFFSATFFILFRINLFEKVEMVHTILIANLTGSLIMLITRFFLNI